MTEVTKVTLSHISSIERSLSSKEHRGGSLSSLPSSEGFLRRRTHLFILADRADRLTRRPHLPLPRHRP